MSGSGSQLEKQELQKNTNKQTPAPAEQKDGNTRGWLSVAAGCMLQFASFGFVNALGSFQVEYEERLLKGHSTSSIAWILTFQLFLMFFLSQPIGLACDLFGPRWVTIPSSLCSVLALIALSYCKEYYQVFLAQGVLFGIGAAGTFMPPLVVAGQHFQEKRSIAIGLTTVGSSLGGVLYPIFFAQLFHRIGFGATIRWSALLTGGVLLIANCLFFPALEPKGWKARRAVISFAALKYPPFSFYLIGGFFFFWAIFGPFNYLPLFAQRFPETRSIYLYTVSILNAGSLFGRTIPAYFSPRLGHLNVLTTFVLLSAIVTLVAWLPLNYYPSLAGLVIYSLVIGFSSGAFISLMTTGLVVVNAGQVGDLGMKLGTYMMTVSFAALTGPPIQGAITDNDNGQLRFLIVFCGISMTISGISFTTVTLLLKRAKKEVST